ncbi:DUF2993 domain-containing protein [Thermomonospora catenispora]|uniref:LmeA family phospholipid-binding protein n=1 Tax=Thermomonospora catenispora TaxID=2493090 RepID=UPI00111D5587|nr:DUF2993 domain-containing protein [Thermomonospora catenispora]TNY36643.1 DUF2993 domain-containing protein [Thermomonospora catenispora]
MRKALAAVVIVLIVGLVAADRIGVRIAEDRIAGEVAAQYGLTERPAVTVHGVPFLTQAVGGEYRRIEIGIGEFTQRGVTVRDVRVEVRDLRAPLGDLLGGVTSSIVAGTATASAVLPYELMRRNAPEQVAGIRPRGENLEVELSGTLAGIPVSGTAVVSVEATPEGVRVTPRSVDAGRLRVPTALLRRHLAWTVPVQRLPIAARITDIQVTPEGLRVTATARDVPLGRL